MWLLPRDLVSSQGSSKTTFLPPRDRGKVCILSTLPDLAFGTTLGLLLLLSRDLVME